MTLNPFQLQFSLSLQHLFLHSAPTPLRSGLLTLSRCPKGEPHRWGEPTARCRPPGAPALRRSRGIAGRRGRGERKGPHRPSSGRPRLAQKICLYTIQLAGHQTQGFPKGFPAISRGEGIKDCPASTLISKGRSGPGTSVGWEPPTAAAGGFGRCLRGVRAAQRLGLSKPGQRVLSTRAEQTLQRLGFVSPAGRGRTREKPLFFFSPAPLPATHGLGLGVGGGGIRGRAPAAAAAISPSLPSLSSRRGSDTGGWQRSCPRRSSCHLDTRLGDPGWIRAHAAHFSLQLCGHVRSSTGDPRRPARAGTPAGVHSHQNHPRKPKGGEPRSGTHTGHAGRAPPRSAEAPRCPSAFLSLRYPQTRTRTPTRLTFALLLQSASSARRRPAAVRNPARRPGAQLPGRRSASRAAGSARASRLGAPAWPADPGSRAAD